MLTFLKSSSLSVHLKFSVYWTVIFVHLFNFQQFYCLTPLQIDQNTVNSHILSRFKRMNSDTSEANPPSPSNNMNIFYRIRADRKGLITCEVNSKENDLSVLHTTSVNQTRASSDSVAQSKPTSTLYLICPQLPTSICYMDCNPNCVLNENGCTIPHSVSQVIEGCQFKRINANTFQYQYIINMERLDHTGLWNCEYRGQRAARSLELQAAERLPEKSLDVNNNNTDTDNLIKQNPINKINNSLSNVQSKLTKENSPKTKAKFKETPQRVTVLNKTGMSAKSLKNSTNATEVGKYDTGEISQFRSTQKQESSQFLEFKLTRPELVLSLVGVLAVSLIVNIILIIRCVLLKSYLDDTLHGNISSNLKCLLCLRLKSDLKMSNTLDKSLNQSNHQPILMTSCHVGQLIEPNASFVNYSTHIDDNLTESVLLYQNKPGSYTPQEGNRLLPMNTSIILPNLFQSTISTTPLPSTTITTNGPFVTTSPTFHHLVNNPHTINPNDILKFHTQQNGHSSSGVSLESDPVSSKRVNLFHSQSVNYSKLSSCHPQLPEYCFQNGNNNNNNSIIGQNGSLNGSLIYSNDSISLTDTTNGNSVVPPNQIILSPQNPHSAYRFQYSCSGEQSEKTTRRIGRQSQQQYAYSNDYNRSSQQHISSQSAHQEGKPIHLKSDQFTPRDTDNDERQNSHDLNAYTFRNSSTIDSLSHGTNNSGHQLDEGLTLHSGQLPTCLTPLVVRFPSGESGFLFCPTRTTTTASENYPSESLSRKANRISIHDNPYTKSIDKEKKSPFGGHLNIQTNLEAIKFDNLNHSSQISQISDDDTKMTFLPENSKDQSLMSTNIHGLIFNGLPECQQNHIQRDSVKNCKIASIENEAAFKSLFNRRTDSKDDDDHHDDASDDDQEINGSELVTQKSLHKVSGVNHTTSSSDDALNEEKKTHQQVLTNSTMYPIF
uniref:Uncharacterized protein n=1 Tax=Trichobilharzia regenti TaxID=157069 RepID=A0AA85JKP9_TRIRE|nr:unnamed protein product [Trichobilharzia regenti]